MSEALKQMEENQIKNLEEKTGKKIGDWISIVKESGLEKHGALVSMLKEKYQMGHGYANLVVHHALQSHAGFAEEEDLISGQYKGKENLRPMYEQLMKEILAFGKDVELSPKKAYVSLRRKKQFAIIQPSTKTRMDVGLNIRDQPATGKLEAAGSWNSMCSHRVILETEEDIDADLIGWIRKSYEQAG
jgi:predicted transport protein